MDAARCVTADGLVVVHGVVSALAPAVAELPGERVLVTYTPEGLREFAVAWWTPGAPSRLVTARCPVTPERPHVTHDERLAALAT